MFALNKSIYVTPGAEPFLAMGHFFNKSHRVLLDDASYQISVTPCGFRLEDIP